MRSGEGDSPKTQPDIQNTLKVAAKETGGAYSLFELSVEPGGKERLHIQHYEDECLYVLSGHFEFVIESERLSSREGDTVYVLKGVLHGFENVGDRLGRLLAIYTPGGSHENFIEESASLARTPGNGLSTLAPDSDAERLRRLGASHGIEIVAPRR